MRSIEAGGARIPVLGFGTWQLRGREAREAVAEAIRRGFRHIDTARMYDNEQAVGEGIRDAGLPRDELFVTTKVWPTDFRREAFATAVDASLKALRLDHVDLLLLHWPSPDVPLEETVDALSAAVEGGKARFAGVSNFNMRRFEAAEAAARVPLVCNQVEFHPFLDQEPLRRFLADRDRALVGYCPLAKGRVFDAAPIRRAAEARGATPAQIALAWELSHDNVAVIPKTANPARVEENLGALRITLDEDERAAIAALASRSGRMVSMDDFRPDWD